MPRLNLNELRGREFWTCSQAARVLGRNADWWRVAFDRGEVDGYVGGGKGNTARHIKAASARALLDNFCLRRRAAMPANNPDAAKRAEYLRLLKERGVVAA